MKKQTNVNTNYQYVEKNIYKTGKSYRVRVNGWSYNTKKISDARKQRKFWKDLIKSEKENVY